MQVFRWRATGLALLCAAVSLAEAPPGGAPQPIQIVVPGAAPQAPKEPSVFDPPKKDSAPRTTKSAVSGTDRFFGDDPDYNTEQRQQWLDTCAPKKETDFAAYRECYQNEKRKSKAEIQRRFDQTERRQQGILRNTGSVPSLGDSPGGSPSFGGAEVESVKEKD